MKKEHIILACVAFVCVAAYTRPHGLLTQIAIFIAGCTIITYTLIEAVSLHKNRQNERREE